MAVERYKSITHKLTGRLAELVIESLQNTEGNTYVVYRGQRDVLIALYRAREDGNLKQQGYESVFSTSGVTRLVHTSPELQTKTRLEKYLYRAIKIEEQQRKEGRR